MTTYFFDLDGTLVKQKKGLTEVMTEPLELLPGVIEKLNEINWANGQIIITTGRKESSRQRTIDELARLGIPYDQLIMGLNTSGKRVLINNLKENSDIPTAIAYNPRQDEGLINIDI